MPLLQSEFFNGKKIVIWSITRGNNSPNSLSLEFFLSKRKFSHSLSRSLKIFYSPCYFCSLITVFSLFIVWSMYSYCNNLSYLLL